MASLEGNKTLAAVLTAGIMAVGAGVVASIIYAPHVPKEMAYAIDIPEEEGADAVEEVAATPLPVLLASADAAAGEGVARKCASCHNFDEGSANKVGPVLWGVMGRDVASASGFGYSDALQAIDGNWDFEAMNGFLENPKGWAPGTSMSYAGIKNEGDRGDLLLYLASISPDAPPLPVAEETMSEAVPAAEAEEAAGEAEVSEEVTEEAAVEAEVSEEVTEEVAEVEVSEEATEEVAEAEASDEATEEVAEVEVTEDAPVETAALAEDATEEVATTEAEAAEETAAEVVVAAVAGDAAAGEKLARRCAACHNFDDGGANKVGPALWGVYGRDIASVGDFSYSEALSGKDGPWDAASLDGFLTSPKDWAPGTKMAYAGLRKEADRANMIAYLQSLTSE